MALKEYKQGTTFPGRMGRTIGESEPAWPAPLRAKDGAPNVLFIVIDDTGFGQLGCYGAPINTPNIDRLAKNGLALHQHAHDGALLADALVHPDRPQPSLERDVVHHRGLDGLPGRQRRDPVRERLPVRDPGAAGLQHYCIGKWHLTPAEQISAAGPYDRWPLGRGFERYYGFLGGDTHQYYPDLVYDNHQVEPPKTPEEGYHLTEDLADKAIEFIADLKQVAPNKPFFLYFAPGAQPRAAPRAEGVGRQVQGQVRRRLGRATASETFARQKELGIIPKNTVLSRHDPDVQDWGKLPADERKLYARMMEVFAGFCEHTDHHIGRLLDFLEKLGELDNTLIMLISDNGASAEGGPTGSVNENKFFNNVPDDLKQNLAAIDDLGGPKYFNHYAVGLDVRRQHAVPALEARDLSRRRQRSVHRPLAEGHQGQGRDSHAVRARHRHGADRARCARHRAADGDPRRDAVADRRRQLRAHLRRRQGGEPSTRRSTSRCSRTARSITTAGARCVPFPGTVVHRGRSRLRRSGR